MAADTDVEVDGRTARRDRNRVAVLDAVLALFAEGELQPRPEAVAERSGISLRSVYRYYSDPAELRRAAMARNLELVGPKLPIPAIGEGPLDERIDRFLAARLALHETIAPSARAARLVSPRSPAVAVAYERTRALLRTQVEQHFRPELERLPPHRSQAIASAVDALAQLDGLDHYRVHQGCTVDEAAALLRIALVQLLAP